MDPVDRQVLERLFPISLTRYTIRPDATVGLVIVDPGQGFTRFGNLADPEHMVPMVGRIADEYRRLRKELGDKLQVLVFLDTHEADIPEPPYPPHCIAGTGEETIDPDLAFILMQPNVTVVRKDCINGFVGAMKRSGEIGRHGDSWINEFTNWVIEAGISTLLFTGDCTDICVCDLVVTSLSARNHGMFTNIDPEDDHDAYVGAITDMNLVVLASACETFDAPSNGHVREAWHQIGLAMMASRGATLASELVVD